jgi:hypothetical protein
MRISSLRWILLLAAALALPATAPAQATSAARTAVPIRFARGATSARVLVALRPGERMREYSLRARGGQTLVVSLTAARATGAFSVACPRCPGAAASFHGFSSQGRWSGVLPATAVYRIRVAATEPGQRFSLTVSAVGPGAAPAPSSPAQSKPSAPAAARGAPAADRVGRAPAAAPAPAPSSDGNLSPAARRAAARGAAAAAATLAPPFRAMLPRLKSESGVPVLLPRDLPREVEAPLFAFGRGTRSGYRITLAHAPGCEAHACNAGYLDAARGRRARGRQSVRLGEGTQAFFTPRSCGASCSAPRLEWSRGGVTYGIALSLPGNDAHHRAVLARVAESAISAGPR